MSRILFRLRNDFFKTTFYKTGILAPKSSLCSSQSNKPIKKTFNTPHPPKDPPEDYNPSCIDHEAFDIRDFVPAAFRPFTAKCEKLGPGADKCGCYKNPEYYSYHRYSFVTLQVEYLNLRAKAKKEDSVRCPVDDKK